MKITVVFVFLVLLVCLHKVSAQTEEKKIELGGQFSVIGVSTEALTVNSTGQVNGTIRDRVVVLGVGGRFGYNFSKYIALETEVNFLPRDLDLEGGRKLQLLAGLKAGRRLEKVGVFAKIRPGFIRYAKGDYASVPGALCSAITPPPISCFTPKATSNFNLDIGGVFELYPSNRTILRVDIGDSMVRRGSRIAAALKPPPPGTLGPTVVVGIPVFSKTTHNFQIGFGFGFRF